MVRKTDNKQLCLKKNYNKLVKMVKIHKCEGEKVNQGMGKLNARGIEILDRAGREKPHCEGNF